MKPDKGNNKRNTFGLITLILWALVLTFLFRSCSSSYASANEVQVDYSTFKEWVQQDKVDRVLMQSGKYTITLKEGVTVEVPEQTSSTSSIFYSWMGNQDRETVYVTTPTPVADLELYSLMGTHGVDYYDKPVDSSTQIMYLLLSYLLPVVIMVGAMMFLFRGVGGKGGMGGLGGVGKANAKVYVEKKTGVTFRDVAGQDEAKESLQEIIDILHNPQKYTDIGAKLPKGVLLVGPPGTGKTLLAKAVAGEAGVPFFSISGSDFVEMFVGVGASRVRDLFKEASKMAPCIIFIDEIDTIGKSRDNRMGGNDEREQTLNQLLAELDGFDPGKGVIVLGATNRPEVLDKALLRPGRFDRRITIDRPNLAGRMATLQVHTRKIKLAEDVNLKKIALATAGCVGADLANLVNEAALRAVRNGRRLVTQEDLLASFEFVIAGSEKKNSVLTEFEKKLVAYHEVGHAMVAYKQKNAEPVQKITIVPHTEGSLGYTLLMPEEDKTNLRTREELMAKITVSMGGRAAEEVVLHTMTNGASQDIQEATNIARNMVAMYGMSDEFGMMALGSVRSQYLDGGYGLDCAQDTAAVMDKQVKLILEQCYKDAVELLKENMDDMHKVVAYLLEKETITGGEMVAIIQGRDPALVEDAYASTHSRQRPLPGDIEPPARNIHMVSESIPAPAPQEEDQGEQDSQKDETPADQPQTQPETPAQPQSAPEEKPEDNGRQNG
ncbi:ATP-dependent zinc metalloprotease FtsH [Flintibacter faecis]|uniref:ATP-dependent zinc metalloprotease FtsH n=1 Tax=Flintibacter faecis TaxID=2763047 RepID=A0A8J6IX57_9FIRM|nr:ATP-dependent zinc metalloprotease FtsH [Flintibacter faecis]MBC5715975.1 ATP-dependent metallopeptidase FtsH/Yme1/Tma family protein [Flintibacter faecis]